MRRGIKVAVWAAVFLASAGVGAYIAANTDPFPPGVDRPGASPTSKESVTPSPSPAPLSVNWVGRLKSSTYHQLYVGGRCTTTWQGSLRFTVAESGKVEGRGAATLAGRLRCDFPIAQVQLRRVSLAVAGRLREGRLTLHLTQTAIYPSNGQDFGGFVAFLPARITLTVRKDAVTDRIDRQRVDEQGRGVYFWSTAFRLRVSVPS
jgi:hypothetical protein